MRVIRVNGGIPLCGKLQVQGSKNAVLPILAATVLHPGVSCLHNCPDISDVADMLEILRRLGCLIEKRGHTICVDASVLGGTQIDKAQAGKMRSSILLLGSLLGRCADAQVAYPGGCVIGARPIDLHVGGLRAMGASVTETDGYVNACGMPQGGTVCLSFASVGATENLLLAAARAQTKTVIEGCAREPEIVALCEFLQEMGAQILGGGTSRIEIVPMQKSRDVEYTIPGDRIVAGTYALATAATRGSTTICGVDGAGWRGQLYPLQMLGAELSFEEDAQALRLDMKERPQGIAFLDTAPYPGFSTDLQSQMLAVLSSATGISCLQETMFEKRFQMAHELVKMGANIQMQKDLVVVQGVERLKGAQVTAQDLRGGAGLVLAALAAEGESRIYGVEFIERGYASLCEDLRALGAQIWIEVETDTGEDYCNDRIQAVGEGTEEKT